MGTKIGVPLVEVVGTPRILPKTLPAPETEKEPVKEKEKVPVEAEYNLDCYVSFT